MAGMAGGLGFSYLPLIPFKTQREQCSRRQGPRPITMPALGVPAGQHPVLCSSPGPCTYSEMSSTGLRAMYTTNCSLCPTLKGGNCDSLVHHSYWLTKTLVQNESTSVSRESRRVCFGIQADSSNYRNVQETYFLDYKR
jgi:hypothetical protein